MMQVFMQAQINAYLARLNDEQLLALVRQHVFSRLPLERKRKLLEALQNEVIRVTR